MSVGSTDNRVSRMQRALDGQMRLITAMTDAGERMSRRIAALERAAGVEPQAREFRARVRPKAGA